MKTAKNEHEACCDEQKLDCEPGIVDVKFSADEVLALYALLERRCSEQECGPYSITSTDVVLGRAKARIANSLALSLKVAAALLINKRTRPLTKLISAALAEDAHSDSALTDVLGHRYLAKQQEKIADGCNKLDDVRAQAAELARRHGGPSEPPSDFEIVEFAEEEDENPTRDYPRRRPPPPVLPSIHGRRARSRRRRSCK